MDNLFENIGFGKDTSTIHRLAELPVHQLDGLALSIQYGRSPPMEGFDRLKEDKPPARRWSGMHSLKGMKGGIGDPLDRSA
jgi:hypothetical protein